MDILLNSNASSSFNSIVDGVETNQNPFVYRYGQSTKGTTLSGISRTFVQINPQSSPQFNSSVDFHIPKNGILKNMWIKMKLTSAVTADKISGAIGAQQISSVQVLSNGRVLATQTSAGLLAKVASQPYGSKRALEALLALSNTNITGMHGGKLFYVPLLMSCFGLEQCYDTNFVAPLVVRCHLSSASAFSGNNATPPVAKDLTAVSMSAYCEFIREPAEHAQARVQADYSDGSLQRVQFNELHEFSEANLNATTQIQHELKTNNYIKEMYISVDLRTNGVQDQGKPVELSSLKLEANGQVIADFGNGEDAKLLQFIGDLQADEWEYSTGTGWDASQASLNHIYKYSFQLSNDSRKVFGGVSSREMSNFLITANVDTGSNATYRLNVVTVYAQLESIESASGKITTSISS